MGGERYARPEKKQAMAHPRMRWTLLAVMLLAACGGAKGRPNLPPPEYEEPAPPTPNPTPTATPNPTPNPR